MLSANFAPQEKQTEHRVHLAAQKRQVHSFASFPLLQKVETIGTVGLSKS